MRYELNGLVVECDVPVHGASVPSADREADLRVTHAGTRLVPPDVAAGTLLQGVRINDVLMYSTVRKPGGDVLLRLHGTAEFEISPDLRNVRAWNDPQCDDELLAILVAGNLLATVLGLEGETVLHASAVERAGVAVAFVAHSGMGKSTLAALACTRGARFVTDDLLRLQHRDDGVHCLRGSGENRLRRPVADLSEGCAGVSARTSVDGRQVWTPPAMPLPSCPLRAVVLPELSREHNELALELLAPGTAVLELTRHPRILGWCDPVVLRSTFANLTALVRSVDVYRARVPWGPPFAPDLVDELLVGVAIPA